MRLKLNANVLWTPLVVVVSLSALITTGFNVRRGWIALRPSVPQPQYIVPDWESYAVEGHRLGPPQAAVTIIVFSDYQCPACKRFEETLESVMARYPRDVRAVIRHFPLPNRTHSFTAALAAICAENQQRFPEMNSALFARSDSFGFRSWRSFAAEAKVSELAKFEACMTRPETERRLQSDIAAARRLGVMGTPTVVVNGQQFLGGSALQLMVKRNLKKAVGDKLRTAKQ